MAKSDLLNISVKLLEALTAAANHHMPVTQAAASCAASVDQIADAVDLLAGLSDRATGAHMAIYLQDDHVALEGDAGWLQPIRLTAPESLALGLVLDRLDIDPALAARVRSAALGDSSEDAAVLVTDTMAYGAHHPALSEAISYGIRCRMSYRGAADNAARERTIDPHHIERAGDAAYLLAWDIDLDEERRFRLDRVEDVVYTEDSVGEHNWSGEGIAQSLRRAGRCATVACTAAFAEQADWAGAVELARDGDRVTLDVAFSTEEWLFDQIISSAGAARILAPEELKHHLSAYAATLLN